MGLTNQERINFNSKVLAANVVDANEIAQWYESRFPFALKLLDTDIALSSDFSQIQPAVSLATAQLNAAAIPSIIEDASVATAAFGGTYNPGVTALRLTPVPGTNGSTYISYNTFNNLTSPQLTNWVSPQKIPLANGAPSNGYQVRLYNGDPFAGGTPVFTSDGLTGVGDTASAAWIFNYDLGMLFVSNDFRATLTDPYILAFRYIGQTVSSVLNASTAGKVLAPARVATDAVLPDTPVYVNGTLGVGATLTGTTAGAGLIVDGIIVALGNRVIVNSQVDQTQNGVYEVTDDGTGAFPYVLTRASDADTASEIAPGVLVTAYEGSANADTAWILGTPDVAIVFGTSNIQFVPVGSSSVVQLIDADADTFITVEETPDVDSVTAYVGDNSGTLNVTNPIMELNATGSYISQPPAVVGNLAGSPLDFASGDGVGTGVGGDISINSGVGGNDGTGGLVTITAGDGGATTGGGGQVDIIGGDSIGLGAELGGNVRIKGGNIGAGIGNAGKVLLLGGTGSVGGGGDIYALAGTGVPAGNVSIYAASPTNNSGVLGGLIELVAGGGSLETGAGGSVSVSGGVGGTNVGNTLGAVGGAVTIAGGKGGAGTTTGGVGGKLELISGDGGGTASGSGDVVITTGVPGTSSPSGNINIFTPNGNGAGGNSGDVTIRTGVGFGGSGTISLLSGIGTAPNGGGDVLLSAGLGFSAPGGNVILKAGSSTLPSKGAILVTTSDVAGVSDLRFMEAANNGTNYVGFKAPLALAADTIWELPDTDGASGQALITNGIGKMTFGYTSGLVDADGDTFVSVDNNPGVDTDTITMTVGTGSGNYTPNTEVFRLSDSIFKIAMPQATAPTASGGIVFIRSGAGAVGGSGAGGAFLMAAGNGGDTGAGGSVLFRAGRGGTTSGGGGSLIIGGESSPSSTAAGGNTQIVSGAGLTGGDIILGVGHSTVNPPAHGNILIQSPVIGGGQTTDLRFEDDTGGYVGFKAPLSVGTSTVWTLPVSDGIAGQALVTDGSAQLSWASAGGLVVRASRGAPHQITNTGITGEIAPRTLHFIEGFGGHVTVTSNPAINIGLTVGQELILMGRNDAATVTLNNGSGLELNGSATLGASDSLSLVWDGTVWVEVNRNI